MTDPKLSPDFWDEAHRTQSDPLLGDTQAEDYAKLFDQVGPFSKEVEEHAPVLEIGPGKGRWLASLPEWQTKFAIDISPVNRKKLETDMPRRSTSAGVRAFAPGYPPWRREGVRLAVALSVFQHCTDAQVAGLLEDVEECVGGEGQGSFYCNGISLHPGFDFHKDGISVSRPLDVLLRLGLAAGLVLAGVKQFAVPGLHIDHYLVRFTR